MQTTTLKPLPRWAPIAREQFLVLSVALRREAIAFVLILLALSLLLGWEYARAAARGQAPGQWTLVPFSYFAAVFIGVFAPVAIWKGDEPARRGYHWAMPVDSWRHSLVKASGGWIWMLAAVLVFAAWLTALGWLTGGEFGVQRAGNLGAEAIAAMPPADQARATWQAPGWQWITPLTGATVAYLFATALVLFSDHPWRWIVGLVTGLFVLMAFAGAAGPTWMRTLLEQVVLGRWGLVPALTGGVPVRETFEWTSGRGTHSHTMDVLRPDLVAWIGATLLWLGIGAGLTMLAARKQER
jgi:hypothetical protein